MTTSETSVLVDSAEAKKSGLPDLTTLDGDHEQIADLEVADEHRTVTGQAIGILQERFDVDAERAFARLKRVLQDKNIKLYALATAATMSLEIDVLPVADDNEETAHLADVIEGVAGEFSPFEELHGFSIDGVDLTTSCLPTGWRERLVRVQNPNTAAAGTSYEFTGWCLDKEDLCVAKLCAQARCRPQVDQWSR